VSLKFAQPLIILPPEGRDRRWPDLDFVMHRFGEMHTQERVHEVGDWKMLTLMSVEFLVYFRYNPLNGIIV